MIQAINLKNLKCFESLNVELSPLTIFCGFNSDGKSTSLQTLLLLSQTLHGRNRTSSLKLNGSLAMLGSPVDILGNAGSTLPLTLGFTSGGVDLRWDFVLSSDRRFLEANRLVIDDGVDVKILQKDELEGLRPLDRGEPAASALRLLEQLVFLSASRGFETDIFPIPLANDLEVGNVGSTGQYASWWLHHQEDAAVQPTRCCTAIDAAPTLRFQLNAWASFSFLKLS